MTCYTIKRFKFIISPSFIGLGEFFDRLSSIGKIEWFSNARYGMFIHYGLYSLLGRHEWVQLREKITVAEYAKLKEQFTAEKFDADLIIAATALEHGRTLATGNAAHFSWINGLNLEDWR